MNATTQFAPSPYQQAIYDFVVHGRGDGAVNAVAGSGKTTTLVEAAKLVRSSNALFLAFNSSIVDELQRRLGPSVPCRTINSLGHRALMSALGGRDRRIRLEKNKYRDIVSEMLVRYGLTGQRLSDAVTAATKLVALVQSGMAEPTDVMLEAIVSHHAIDPVDGFSDVELFSAARHALKRGEEMAKFEGVISFDDQIYLPVKWGLRPQRADFVMIDEAQDLSTAKLELVLSARAPGGRMLFVGDPRQAIYGFAGADANSFANIVQRTNATELPLSVCYRCPTKAIERAKKIVPAIEAAPGAAIGAELRVREDQVALRVAIGDLLLCRKTAPLIAMCVKLIAARIPARVKGRDIGRSIIKTAKDALGRMPFADLDVALDAYVVKMTAVLEHRKNREESLARLHDRVEGVRACRDAFPDADSLETFTASIDELFSDDTAAVELSTVHRAKGLEAERVWILEPESLPLTWEGQMPWQFVQELNLAYVAYTRTKGDLFFVDPAPVATAVAA